MITNLIPGLGSFGRSPFNLNFLAALQGGAPNPLIQQQLLAQIASGLVPGNSNLNLAPVI